MTRNAASTAIKKRAPATRPAPRPAEAIAKLASDEAVPVASHVHDLQDLLAQRLEPPPSPQWSTRATLSFVVVVCGGFWLGVFLTVRFMLR
jgi:hypothetical protein